MSTGREEFLRRLGEAQATLDAGFALEAFFALDEDFSVDAAGFVSEDDALFSLPDFEASPLEASPFEASPVDAVPLVPLLAPEVSAGGGLFFA